MANCTTQLRTLEPGTTSCTYHISVENDPDNWWYSPFGETDVSGAYKLTAPDATATGGATGTGAVTRASAYERGSDFGVFSDGTGIECSDNSNFNWSLTGPVEQQGMCIDVDPTSRSMRAPSQVSSILSQEQCSNAATQRWITRATAFSPSNVVPGTHTNYVLEGCAQDCTPPDLATKNMRQVSGISDGLSYKNFDKNIQCLAGFNAPAPAPGASGSPPNVQDYLSTGVGVPARVCGQPGSPYVVGNGCTANCTFGDQVVNPGYKLAEWGAAVTNNPDALANFGVDHWSSDYSGNLLTCNDGYYRTASNAFLEQCVGPGTHVLISAGDDDTGCIADCRPDPESEAKIYSNTGAATEAAHLMYAPLEGGSPGAGVSLELVTFPYSATIGGALPTDFTCPQNYEPGPGAMPSVADGVTVHSTPTYEHCGKLPGSYDYHWSYTPEFTKATRNNYAVTGCYPACNRETEICLNYTARKPITDATRQTADSWRSEMGAALLAAENRLSPNNISYVRTQVLNNDPVTDFTDPTDLVPEQIYEWQFKCSKDICSMTGDGEKINLTTLLGPDGIPTAPPVQIQQIQQMQDPSGPRWILGDEGENCIATCGSGRCATGDWSINDTTSMTTAMESAGVDVGTVCNSFPGPTYNPYGPYVATGGRCYTTPVDTVARCEEIGGGVQRLCKCDP